MCHSIYDGILIVSLSGHPTLREPVEVGHTCSGSDPDQQRFLTILLVQRRANGGKRLGICMHGALSVDM